jgi:hypothetical protein
VIARRLHDVFLEDGGRYAREWVTGSVLGILTFTEVIKQPLGNHALVVRATWWFGRIRVRGRIVLGRRGSTEYVLHLAELRDVEADVEGDGGRESRARREWKRCFALGMGFIRGRYSATSPSSGRACSVQMTRAHTQRSRARND